METGERKVRYDLENILSQSENDLKYLVQSQMPQPCDMFEQISQLEVYFHVSLIDKICKKLKINSSQEISKIWIQQHLEKKSIDEITVEVKAKFLLHLIKHYQPVQWEYVHHSSQVKLKILIKNYDFFRSNLRQTNRGNRKMAYPK